MIEWNTLVLEARRKAAEINPRACLITDADIVLAMADEIERLGLLNIELACAIKTGIPHWREDARMCSLINRVMR